MFEAGAFHLSRSALRLCPGRPFGPGVLTYKPAKIESGAHWGGVGQRHPMPQNNMQGTGQARAKREEQACLSPEVIVHKGDQSPRETTIAGLDKTTLLIDIAANTNAVTATSVMVTANSDKEIPCETNGTISFRSAY